MALSEHAIQSRAALEAAIDRAITLADAQLARTPGWGAMQAIKGQLVGLRGAIAGGRTPTFDEQQRASVGTLAMRELPDEDELSNLLHEIQFFFNDWPLPPGA